MGKHTNPTSLDEKTFAQALSELCNRNPTLAAIVSKWGEPPFWVHKPGFPGLVLAILSQQVSLESANATFTKLEKRLGTLSPDTFLKLDDNELRKVGFSRQKASYVRDLAANLINNVLSLDALVSMPDEEVRETLISIRGVGSWTADTYLLFALRRPDAWPSGDLALAKAIQELEHLETIPEWDSVDQFAEAWRPWRAVAARILWHYYLSVRGRS